MCHRVRAFLLSTKRSVSYAYYYRGDRHRGLFEDRLALGAPSGLVPSADLSALVLLVLARAAS